MDMQINSLVANNNSVGGLTAAPSALSIPSLFEPIVTTIILQRMMDTVGKLSRANGRLSYVD